MYKIMLFDNENRDIAIAVELTEEQLKLFDYLLNNDIIDSRFIPICVEDIDFERP